MQCKVMGKKPFTTRIDEEVLALAQRIADVERRSVTSVIELAVIDFAAEKGFRLSSGPPEADATRDPLLYLPDASVPIDGTYRCAFCDEQVRLKRGERFPPADHHVHPHLQPNTLRWALLSRTKPPTA